MAVDDEWHMLASGYNGAPSGLPHCIDVECLMIEGHCLRTVHSEINMICHAARLGASLRDARVFITNRPCMRCSVALIQCKVKEVIYCQEYWSEISHVEQLEMFSKSGTRLLLWQEGKLWIPM